MVVELKSSTQNCVAEWSFSSRKEYTDPFNEVELSAIFIDPDEEEKVVPAFWAGGNFWRMRYASHRVGRHRFRTVCSDEANSYLHDQDGILEVVPYKGENPLLKHGPLRVSQNRRYLEHIDGTPFFWLGDTWWMGLTKRLPWPEGFKMLTADRAEKGFTVIQIVAGLYPDMAPFDPRGANEAGLPWEKGYVQINPAYFDMADRRIDWLVQNRLVPCIVGSWGYFIELAGEETMKKHWLSLVARYGAYPVVWCVAGEAIMPNYLSLAWHDKDKQKEYQIKARAEWTRVTRYLRSLDPYHHPITIHPSCPDCARNMVDDPSAVDIDMLQTGHWDIQSLPTTVNMVTDSIARSPRMPVLVGEVCYEGIMGASWENIQRLMFWASILSGAAGHTYGANGIWQVNSRKEPYGPSPHQQSWGEMPWDDAYRLSGSRQLSLAKRLLERYSWWRFEPHLEWIEPHWSEEDYLQPYGAGIPSEVRVFYIQGVSSIGILGSLPRIKKIEHGVTYHAFYFNPQNGKEYDLGTVVSSKEGEWQPPAPPIIQDWIMVMEAKG